MNEHARDLAQDAAWQMLDAGAASPQFASAWLSLQCEMIPEVRFGWLFRVGDGEDLQLAARRDGAAGTAVVKSAMLLAGEALQQRSGLVEEVEQPPGYLLALPLMDHDAVRAVAAVCVGELSGAALQRIMRQLQWGGGWALEWGRGARPSASAPSVDLTSETASDVFRLFAATVEPERFKEAAAALATRMAHILRLERASIGLVKGKRVRIVAISHVVHSDARMGAMRRIEEAMHEAIDQGTAVVVPAQGAEQGVVTRAAQEILAGRAAGCAVAAVPLEVGDRTIGALLLEKATPFAPDDLKRIDALAVLSAPVLQEKHLNDRWLVAKIGSAFRSQLQKLLGRRHPVRKLVVAGLASLILSASLVDWPYHVLAPVVVEAEARRVVPAPFDGYLAQALVRPGDKVTAGQPLASLDDSDLRLERLGLIADREQRSSELRAATAKYELAKTNMLRAEIDQIEAKLRLVDARLERTRVRAPIDGIVLSGDLSQSIGEPVKSGAALFELAPEGAFRLIVNVDELDIGDIVAGQSGRAVLAALPEKTLGFSLVRVTPVLEAQGGRNYYRVEARLDEPEPALRPGLIGRARVAAGERRVIWIWTHGLTSWLRLQSWSLIP